MGDAQDPPHQWLGGLLSGTSSLSEAALLSLTDIKLSEAQQHELVQRGYCSTLLALLRDTTRPSYIHHACLAVLLQLCMTDVGAAAVVNDNGVAVVLQHLSTAEDHAQRCLAGGVLGLLVVASMPAREQAAKQGALLMLLDLLQQAAAAQDMLEDEQINLNLMGLKALEGLVQDPAAVRQVVQAGGVAKLLALVSDSLGGADDEAVQETCCSVAKLLQQIATHADLAVHDHLVQKAASVLVAILREGVEETQTAAAQALLAMCRSEAGRQQVMQADVCLPLFAVLGRTDSPSTKQAVLELVITLEPLLSMAERAVLTQILAGEG